MTPKQTPPLSDFDLYRSHFNQILNQRHELILLGKAIDWSIFDREFGPLYDAAHGRPGLPTRLMVGLHFLKHAFNESDESMCAKWVENAYWQAFCGFEYFQHELPLHPTSLVKWRKRIGPERMETLLGAILDTGKRAGEVKESDLKRVIVDTTVQEKAVMHPTDARLLRRMAQTLNREARAAGIRVRQSYERVMHRLQIEHHRMRRANKKRKANRVLHKMRKNVERLSRDLMRKGKAKHLSLIETLMRAGRLLTQHPQSKDKLYSVHAPEVECIGKGKVHKPYEFGVKTGFVTTLEGNWIVGMRTFPGNPHDSLTLRPALEQTTRLTGVAPTDAYVDKGYRGCDVRGETRIHMAGQRYGTPSRAERRRRRRRAAIEPIIGHTKYDHRMIRCHLKGADGDAINATLAACGFNLSKLLRAIRVRIFVLVPERLFLLIRNLKTAIHVPRTRWFASAVA
jgi:IS5 family transposase